MMMSEAKYREMGDKRGLRRCRCRQGKLIGEQIRVPGRSEGGNRQGPVLDAAICAYKYLHFQSRIWIVLPGSTESIKAPNFPGV